MSYKNRKNEYDRLVKLERQADIPQELKDEFSQPAKVAVSSSKKRGKR